MRILDLQINTSTMKLSTLSIVFLFLILFYHPCQGQTSEKTNFFSADNALIQYTGRIDFSDLKKPKFWAPGVYIKAKFSGTSCSIHINDEGHSLNYLEIVIDNNTPFRIKLKEKTNIVNVAEGLTPGEHTITICKNTETNIGYVEFLGLTCDNLLPLPAKPERKIEFIGNSITCGTGADLSAIACGQGRWHDQHNAYMSYGPITARALDAQWHLTAYSGIGMIRSCCNLPITMPLIFDKLNLHTNNGIPWDFSRYQPDAVTVCLGQNDGIQDSVAFCSAYVNFIGDIRNRYPKAQIVCLTSPMGNKELTDALKNYITGVIDHVRKNDSGVHKYFFTRSFNSGCDAHPDMNEHELIASELTAFLKTLMKW